MRHIASRAGMITRNVYMQGKGEFVWDTWPNRLVLRLSLQSGNETNDPLKSGPAKAGPAGPATPPRNCVHTFFHSSLPNMHEHIHMYMHMYTHICTLYTPTHVRKHNPTFPSFSSVSSRSPVQKSLFYGDVFASTSWAPDVVNLVCPIYKCGGLFINVVGGVINVAGDL